MKTKEEIAKELDKVYWEEYDFQRNCHTGCGESHEKGMEALATHVRNMLIEAEIRGMTKVMYKPFPHNHFADEIKQLQEMKGKEK